MESTVVGLEINGVVLDSSVLIAAEHRKLRPDQTIESVQKTVGEISIVICALTVAEIGHGIYRANTPVDMRRQPRLFDPDPTATSSQFPALP